MESEKDDAGTQVPATSFLCLDLGETLSADNAFGDAHELYTSFEGQLSNPLPTRLDSTVDRTDTSRKFSEVSMTTKESYSTSSHEGLTSPPPVQSGQLATRFRSQPEPGNAVRGAANSSRLPRAISPEKALAIRKYVHDFFNYVEPIRGRFSIHPHIFVTMMGLEGVGMDRIIFSLANDAFLIGYDPHQPQEFTLSTYFGGKLVELTGTKHRPNLELSAATWPLGYWSPYLETRHCEAHILIYDVTNRESFDAMRSYYDNICLERRLERPDSQCRQCRSSRQVCPPRPQYRGLIFVIANKIDYDQAEWAVPLRLGEAYSESIGAMFLPMSAKTGEGCGRADALEMVSHILYRRIENRPQVKRETGFAGEDSKPPASDASTDSKTPAAGVASTRPYGCWPSFNRRWFRLNQLKQEREGQSEKAATAETGTQPDLSNPNWLYMY